METRLLFRFRLAGLYKSAVPLTCHQRIGQMVEKGFQQCRDDIDVIKTGIRWIQAIKTMIEVVREGFDFNDAARLSV